MAPTTADPAAAAPAALSQDGWITAGHDVVAFAHVYNTAVSLISAHLANGANWVIAARLVQLLLVNAEFPPYAAAVVAVAALDKVVAARAARIAPGGPPSAPCPICGWAGGFHDRREHNRRRREYLATTSPAVL